MEKFLVGIFVDKGGKVREDMCEDIREHFDGLPSILLPSTLLLSTSSRQAGQAGQASGRGPSASSGRARRWKF